MEAQVSTDLSIVTLVLQASPVVQAIMGMLLLTSLCSWWIIFNKMLVIRHALKETLEFERVFWGGSDLNALYRQCTARAGGTVGLERLFEAGFSEFLKLKRQGNIELSDAMASTRRAMNAASQREIDRLESHVPFLGTVGSVSPYVGLLGTVWGIMNAFQGLASVGQATLSQVAPGIAEALVATAMGLFAAIPAVVAYNRYVQHVDRVAVRFDSFMEEFSNILQRQGAQR